MNHDCFAQWNEITTNNHEYNIYSRNAAGTVFESVIRAPALKINAVIIAIILD